MNTSGSDQRSRPGVDRRRTAVIVGAAAVAAAAAVGVGLATGAFGPRAATGDALELSLPDTGGAMASCLPFTVDHLADMTPAFGGTVTAVTDDRVTLDVDRWYTGGNASTVVLEIPPGAHAALIGEIDFRVGGQYLITASEGSVNMCGYSGEATPEMEAAFDAAF